jgi:hypothetical protein
VNAGARFSRKLGATFAEILSSEAPTHFFHGVIVCFAEVLQKPCINLPLHHPQRARRPEQSSKGVAPSTNPAQPSQQQAPEIPKDFSWADLVARIRDGDRAGMEDLYRIFSKRVRFFLYQQLGPQDLGDKVHRYS